MVCRVVASLVVAVVGVGGAGDAVGVVADGGGYCRCRRGSWERTFPWSAGRRRQVIVVVVVSMVRLLEALHWVMAPLVRPMVSAGVAMGGGAGGDG